MPDKYASRIAALLSLGLVILASWLLVAAHRYEQNFLTAIPAAQHCGDFYRVAAETGPCVLNRFALVDSQRALAERCVLLAAVALLLATLVPWLLPRGRRRVPATPPTGSSR